MWPTEKHSQNSVYIKASPLHLRDQSHFNIDFDRNKTWYLITVKSKTIYDLIQPSDLLSISSKTDGQTHTENVSRSDTSIQRVRLHMDAIRETMWGVQGWVLLRCAKERPRPSGSSRRRLSGEEGERRVRAQQAWNDYHAGGRNIEAFLRGWQTKSFPN